MAINFEKVEYENPHYVICPDCGKKAYYDVVDIGVGLTQCGPAGCDWCGWIQSLEVK